MLAVCVAGCIAGRTARRRRRRDMIQCLYGARHNAPPLFVALCEVHKIINIVIICSLLIKFVAALYYT